MKTLVLCIDRDDDLGRKAGIKSPIIGREKNLEAAKNLALIDPEDSDVNCLFSAISTYDKLEDAEIVTICGDTRVGIISDEKIAKQLDEVLKKIKPEKVILVTDGVEDEYVIPIIESRVKIDALRRVVVKQSQTLEGAYYLLTRLMEDEKMKRRFFLPIAIVLLIWGFSVLFGSISIGFSSILIVLGLYLLMRIFHLENSITKFGKEIVEGLRKGRMTIFSSILSSFIILASVISAIKVLSNLNITYAEYIARFINEILWWFIISILLVAMGRFIDVYFKERRILWGYTIIPFSLIAIGLILSASLSIIIELIKEKSLHFILMEYVLSISFLTKIIAGILIAFIGSVLYHIVEDTYKEEEE